MRVWPSSGRKVYMAERAIRTVGDSFDLKYKSCSFSVQRGHWKNNFHKASAFVKMAFVYTGGLENYQ